MTPLEEIKSRVDIVDLVGEAVPLKQSGRNFKANCPFHNERTPSFYVFPERQSWRCFGACADGGDIFSFVMRREGVQFGEALRALAQRAGVPMEAPQAAREKAGKADLLKRLQRDAAMFFHQALLTSPEAETARAYLNKRGLTETTIQDYRLGYSHVEARSLERYLTNQDFTQEDMLAAGLLRQREENQEGPSRSGSGVYGFFRGKLMIPIQDKGGDYLGFGARALDDSHPKYINSPQSLIFDKSAILYGLHRATDAIKQEKLAVIVEGYMDVLTAHQHGFRNVVAPMGTALTEKQVGALKRLSTTFVLALDPDAAGDEATLRSLEGAWHIMDRPAAAPQNARLTGKDTTPDLVLKVMDLPRGQDPDDVIREQPHRWPELIASATPVVDYIFQALAHRFDLTASKGKAALTQRLTPFIHSASNVFEQNQRIRKLAHLLGEEENIVRLAIGGLRSVGQKRAASKAKAGEAARPVTRQSNDVLERYCIAMLLRYPELLPLPAAARLSREHFNNAALQQMYALLAGGIPPEELKARLDQDLEQELNALLDYSLTLAPANYRERELGFAQNVLLLERRRLRTRSEALQSRLIEDQVIEDQVTETSEELQREAGELQAQMGGIDRELQEFAQLQEIK